MPHDFGTLGILYFRDEPLENSQSSPEAKKNFLPPPPLTLLGYPPSKVFLYLALKYSQPWSNLGLLFRMNRVLNSKSYMAY